MTIDELEQMWSTDGQIDITDLQKEVSRIPKLHHKYFTEFVKQRRRLRQMQIALKRLRLEKYEFLINPTADKQQSGWEIPPQGRLLKNEVSQYLEGDKDILSAELRIGSQQDIVDMLKSIIDSIMTRNFLIKSIQDDRRYMSGG